MSLRVALLAALGIALGLEATAFLLGGRGEPLEAPPQVGEHRLSKGIPLPPVAKPAPAPSEATGVSAAKPIAPTSRGAGKKNPHANVIGLPVRMLIEPGLTPDHVRDFLRETGSKLVMLGLQRSDDGTVEVRDAVLPHPTTGLPTSDHPGDLVTRRFLDTFKKGKHLWVETDAAVIRPLLPETTRATSSFLIFDRATSFEVWKTCRQRLANAPAEHAVVVVTLRPSHSRGVALHVAIDLPRAATTTDEEKK